MSCTAWFAIACALGAHVGSVRADSPMTFEESATSPDGSVQTTVRTVIQGNTSTANITGRATATSVDGEGEGSFTGFTFDADAASSGIVSPASPGDENAPNDAIDDTSDELKRNSITAISTLTNACGCKVKSSIVTSDIRNISDTWMADGDSMSTHKLSNMVWAWGQVSFLASSPT